MALRKKREVLEEPQDYEIERRETPRYNPDPEAGLSAAQVEQHRDDGWRNVSVAPPAQTTKEIIRENVCTYFNLIFLVLAILLCLVGSFRDLTFLPVIIFKFDSCFSFKYRISTIQFTDNAVNICNHKRIFFASKNGIFLSYH